MFRKSWVNFMKHEIKPTLLNLCDYFGANKKIGFGNNFTNNVKKNPHHEPALGRRYNHAHRSGSDAVRLVFLNTLKNEDPLAASRLLRAGSPFWCYKLSYEGLSKAGYRRVGFTLSKKSHKRFVVEERHILVVPARVRIYPKFWDEYKQRCTNFGAIFTYTTAINMMYLSSKVYINGGTTEDFVEKLAEDSPYKIGALVRPRLGLFAPAPRRSKLITALKNQYKNSTDVLTYEFETWCRKSDETLIHPGVLISRSAGSGKGHGLYGKEIYSVQLGRDTYENVHPNELEIVRKQNE